MRKIAFVPTLLTLGNGVCGFASITYASKIHDVGVTGEQIDSYFSTSGWFILAAMIFDLLDGYVARLSKTASDFGGELDSLCDAISFGVAPAFLLLKMGPPWEPVQFLHQLTAAIAALYMVCTILRLARFNVQNTPDPSGHKRFRGLPSPGAAGCLATLAIIEGGLHTRLTQIWADLDAAAFRVTVHKFVEGMSPVGALVVGLLMVSLVPYPHVSKQIFRGRRHASQFIQLLLAIFITALFPEVALLLIFWVYALYFALRYLVATVLHRDRDREPLPDLAQH